MKRAILLFWLVVLPLAANAALIGEDAPPPPINGNGASFGTVFSPPEALTPAVVKAIGSAKKSVRVAARYFTSKPIAEALIAAIQSGKEVQVVLDKDNDRNGTSAASFLSLMSHPARLAKQYDHFYASYMIIDDTDVLVGKVGGLASPDEDGKSPSALLIIHNAPELAKKYRTHWQKLWVASQEMKYDRK